MDHRLGVRFGYLTSLGPLVTVLTTAALLLLGVFVWFAASSQPGDSRFPAAVVDAGRPVNDIPGLSPDQVASVQAFLRRRGFDPGPSDGAPGPRTRDAIRRFELSQGWLQTGNVSPRLLERANAP